MLLTEQSFEGLLDCFVPDEELEDLQQEYKNGDSSGWGSVIIIEEDEYEEGNMVAKGPSKIMREKNEVDEVMQSRYLQFLED